MTAKLIWEKKSKASIVSGIPTNGNYYYKTDLGLHDSKSVIFIEQKICNVNSSINLTKPEAEKLLIWLRDTLPHMKD